MLRLTTALVFGTIGLGSLAAQAEGSRRIPIAHDLNRFDRIDDRLARGGFVPVARRDDRRRADAPGYSRRDPGGVVGFSGPPGPYGDSVNGFGAVPPGSPANLDGDLY